MAKRIVTTTTATTTTNPTIVATTTQAPLAIVQQAHGNPTYAYMLANNNWVLAGNPTGYPRNNPPMPQAGSIGAAVLQVLSAGPCTMLHLAAACNLLNTKCGAAHKMGPLLCTTMAGLWGYTFTCTSGLVTVTHHAGCGAPATVATATRS